MESRRELEKRQRLREEAVQRRRGEFCYPLDSSVSEGGEKGKAEAKRKMVGREEVEAKRRRIDKEAGVGREEVEAGVAVKYSQEQGMEERQTPGNKRKMGREEVEAKRRRIDKEPGVAVKCSQEQGNGSKGKGMDRRSKKDLSLTSLKKKKIAVREETEAKERFKGEDGAAVTGMDMRKKENSFPSLKRKRIAERDEAEATKRISLSSSPVCSSTDSCSHDRVCSSNGSSSRSQDRVCSSSNGSSSRGKRTHLKVS